MAINKRNQKPESRNQNNLKDKNILITAGPTWVPIDNVRVISNIATGSTGILLAEHLSKLGAKVTLILGPVPNVAFLRREAKKVTTFGISSCCINRKVKIINFRFFDELKEKIQKELGAKKYDIVIHSAAVSDYRPTQAYKGKITSGKKLFSINLRPTPKLFAEIRRKSADSKLVIFKLEFGVKENLLKTKALKLLKDARADLVVANTFCGNSYKAFIIDKGKRVLARINKKAAVAQRLISIIKSKL